VDCGSRRHEPGDAGAGRETGTLWHDTALLHERQGPAPAAGVKHEWAGRGRGARACGPAAGPWRHRSVTSGRLRSAPRAGGREPKSIWSAAETAGPIGGEPRRPTRSHASRTASVFAAAANSRSPAKTRRSLVASSLIQSFCCVEAIAYGHGGLRRVAALLGLAKETVARGMRELRDPGTVQIERVRKPGGGRKPTTDTDPELRADLERLVSPSTRGDPQSPLRWTCKSRRKLAEELTAMRPGRSVSRRLVGDLLHEMGYSLQAPRKVREGTDHPDRDAQFQHLNATVLDYQHRGRPVISVDTKHTTGAAGRWRPTRRSSGSSPIRRPHGLKVQCRLDTHPYPAGVKVPDDEINPLRIERADFHADWNDVIHPRTSS
jgi:transposase